MDEDHVIQSKIPEQATKLNLLMKFGQYLNTLLGVLGVLFASLGSGV